jgi:peptide deformylase
MKRRILHYGEEPLRQESKPVTTIDDDLRALVKDMFETMYQAHGVGLAAPQVGVNLRLFLIDTGNAPMVFINPEIVKTSGKEICEEGCLSFPGLGKKWNALPA